MLVERYDKKLDPRADEIQRDWRAWATSNGYFQRDAVPVEYESEKVALEIWDNPAQVDQYLIYIPRIPHTAGDGGEKLFIIDQDHFAFMMDAAQKMVTIAMILAKEKWKVRQDQNAMLN